MFPRFVQVHTLTSFAAGLLNRDDAGFAKRIPFGSAVRTRVSSQCLKRHWRRFQGPQALGALGVPMSIRSRHTLEERLVRPLVEEDHLGQPLARAIVDYLASEVLGESAKAKAEKAKASAQEGESGEAPMTGQVTVLGQKELDYLREQARKIAGKKPDPKKVKDAAKEILGKDGLANLRTMTLGAGLDAALFGRMVTSDILARCDAAIHVAHAFTVHKEQREDDYFTAVDDLRSDEGKQGAGHVNSNELTSGLFYGYVVADVPLLVSNLTGCKVQDWEKADHQLSGRVIESLVHLIATVSPGAKLGSTAPHSLAHAVLVEAGSGQPCTLANAFLDPVPLTDDVVGNAYAALAQEILDLDINYTSNKPSRAHMARGKESRYEQLATVLKKTGGEEKKLQVALGQRLSLDDLAKWASTCVTTGVQA